MLSISALGAASGGKAAYYQNLATKDDYYQNGGEPPGEWIGNGIEALGLRGKITTHDLVSLFKGIDHITGEELVQGAGGEHRAGWDLTFSAPKSVTAAWAVADPALRAKIEAAQAKAVERAIKFIEDKAGFTRRGKAGAEAEKLPGLIVGKYSHSTSREEDPQLHDHCLVMNLAQRADGTWGGIESKNFYKWQKAAGAAYRAELASAVSEIGFQLKADGDFFKIAGVPQNLCEFWSKRRQAIEAKLEETGFSGARASEIAALGTREVKCDIDRAELHKRWQKESAELGMTAKKVQALTTGATIDDPDIEPGETEQEMEKPETIYEKLTWNNSVFTEQELFERVAIEQSHEPQGAGVDTVEERVASLLADREILKMRSAETGEIVYTTSEMRKLETEIVTLCDERQDDKSHTVDSKIVDKAFEKFEKEEGFQISDEQQKAVRAITQDEGAVKLVRGAAGAGKSTLAMAARMSWESRDLKVIGCAPSGKAAKGLQESAQISSSTIHRLLYDLDSGKKMLDKSTVVLCDEAGMVGSRLMHKLSSQCAASGAKLVLVGDHKQIQSVSAGAPFRLLQKYMGVSEITEVRRQKKHEDIEAARAISEGKGAKALASYHSRGMVDIVKLADDEKYKPGASQILRDKTMQTLVDSWFENAGNGDGSSRARIKESLILAGTRADVYALNQIAREKMRDAHQLCNEHTVKTQYGERQFAEGDRILMGKNESKLGLKNGELGFIERLEIDKQGNLQAKIKLDGGKVKSLQLTGKDAYKHIDHGYAVTSHKSQGATVDDCFVYVSKMSDMELGYVQMSRHRDNLKLFASGKLIEDSIELAAEMGNLDEAEAAKMLENMDIKAWSKIMETSHQKSTSLDFEIVQEPVALAETQLPAAKIAEEAAVV